MMKERKREIGEVRATVNNVAQHMVALAGRETAPAPCPPHPAAGNQVRRQVAVDVTTAAASTDPEAMEGVVTTGPEQPAQLVPKDPVEDWSDMEGVERQGLYASRHAPVEGEELTMSPAAVRPVARKEKGKGKEATPAAPRPILKRPETVAAEKAAKERKEAEARRKAEEKEVARKRWEDWSKMTEMEQRTYDEVVRPIRATVCDKDTMEDTGVIQRIAHKAGIQAVEERWERMYDDARAPQNPPRQQQQ
jgi:hypothetical protein